jgi:hypothetical protein
MKAITSNDDNHRCDGANMASLAKRLSRDHLRSDPTYCRPAPFGRPRLSLLRSLTDGAGCGRGGVRSVGEGRAQLIQGDTHDEHDDYDGTDEAIRCSRVRRKPAVSRIVWLCRPEAVVSMDHQRAHIAPSEPLHYGWSRCTAHGA